MGILYSASSDRRSTSFRASWNLSSVDLCGCLSRQDTTARVQEMITIHRISTWNFVILLFNKCF